MGAKKKVRGHSLKELVSDALRTEETRMLFAERRFYLQVAHLVLGLRQKLGISQVELARRARVSQPLIARLEKGDQRRTPTFDTVYKILKALGYTMEITVKPDLKKVA